MEFVIPTRDSGRECVGYVPNMITRAPREAILKHMSPDEFLQQADPSFSPRNKRGTDFRPRSIRHIVQTVKNGGCFAPLELWPGSPRSYGLKHEGRHRAWVARHLGVERVPVFIWLR